MPYNRNANKYDYRDLIVHQIVQILDDINVGQGLCSYRLSHIGRIVQDEIPNIINHIHIIILSERQEQNGKSRALALQRD
ncbi:MAG: hypothetical protein RR508_02030 [Oscillospiraceae bacterium]